MTKTKKLSLALTLVMAVAIMLTAFAALTLGNKVYAVSFKEDIGIKAEYTLGDELEIPEGVLVVNGKDYAATAVVTLPDGSALKTSKLTLNALGNYSVKYSVTVDGKYYSESVEFTVKKQAMSVSGSNSSFVYDEETDRIHLSLASYDEFSFNHPIDLSGKTKDDTLISLYVNSSLTGTRDFEKYVIVLTDAYDPTNKVYVRVQGDWGLLTQPSLCDDPDDIYYYVRWQSYAAVNFDGGKMWTSISNGTINTRDIHGKPVWTSFSNEGNLNNWRQDNVSVEDDVFTLSYDAETKQLHTLGKMPADGTSGTLIADLDDPAFFSNGWKGFTGDKCYISVYAEEVHTKANFVIKSIASEDSKTGTVEDNLAPDITVDFGDYTEATLPSAIVGKPYAIFGATASDMNLASSVISTKVYYNYGTANQVRISTDGATFTPSNRGAYTIVYSISDAYGNESERIVNIAAISEPTPLVIAANDMNVIAGVDTLIPAPELVSYDKNTGKLHLTVKAIKGGKEDVIYDGEFNSYEGLTYRFMTTGEYTLVYAVSDYITTVEKTCKATSSAVLNIIYDNFNSLPIDRYFVVGSTYILPSVNVASFNDNETVYTAAGIKVIAADGSETVLDGNEFTVTSAMGENLTIVYFDKSNENVKIEGTREIFDIGSVSDYKLDKLFISDTEVSADDNAVYFKTDKDTSIAFINKIAAQDIKMSFALQSTDKNLAGFNIILTDAVNPDISVKINIRNLYNAVNSQSGNSKVSVEGGSSEIVVAPSFTGLNNEYFDITYTNQSRIIKLDNKTLSVDTCVNGEAFNGFTSGSAYVSFEMNGVKGDSTLEMYSINGQYFSSYYEDFGKPAVSVNGNYASKYDFGTVLSTKTAAGIDTVSGYCYTTVTVRLIGQNGNVKDVNGVAIKDLDASKSYDIKLDGYGEYIISYSAVDASGNKSSNTYSTFYVEDNEKPTIELVSKPSTVAKVGDKFVMPELSVSDNRTENLEAFAVITNPENDYKCVTADGYTFTMKGSYMITLGVFDEQGNLATIVYYVEVV